MELSGAAAVACFAVECCAVECSVVECCAVAFSARAVPFWYFEETSADAEVSSRIEAGRPVFRFAHIDRLTAIFGSGCLPMLNKAGR